jgi:hypothetical protein
MTMGRISQQTDNEGHTALDDPPPQYEAVSQNPWDAGGTRVLRTFLHPGTTPSSVYVRSQL